MARDAGKLPGNTPEINDTAMTLLQHHRRGVLHSKERAPEMYVCEGIKLVDVDFRDAGHTTRRAGIVHQAIEPSKPRQAVDQHRLHIRFLRDIGLDEAC
jgi:hypothetical protein